MHRPGTNGGDVCPRPPRHRRAMFSAPGEQGINILAISTSISTLSCVIDADRLCDAVAAMQKTFDLP